MYVFSDGVLVPAVPVEEPGVVGGEHDDQVARDVRVVAAQGRAAVYDGVPEVAAGGAEEVDDVVGGFRLQGEDRGGPAVKAFLVYRGPGAETRVLGEAVCELGLGGDTGQVGVPGLYVFH